jgi:hypothetical protein
MKTLPSIISTIISVSVLLIADVLSSSALALPAFPEAQGYGTQTIGGRGGTICEVINLNDTGAGSLRDCVEVKTGARTVVFRVGGTIPLTRDIIINAQHSYLTIAGQTATGGGIQLKNWGIYIQDGAHDVVIRYLRVRPGSDACIAQGGTACDYVSGISMWGETIAKRVYNVVLDHISAEWATDQNTTVWDSVSDVTIQNSIIAEGATTGHSKGQHSTGFLAGGDIKIDTTHPRTVSIHHSIFAHNGERNPRVGDPAIFDFRNNVVYYYGEYTAGSFSMEYPVSTYPKSLNTLKFNFINNIYKKSPTDPTTGKFIVELDKQSRIYINGNYTPAYPAGTSNDFNTGNIAGGNASINKLSSPVATPVVTTDATSAVLAKVLVNAGAKLPSRDSIDMRIVNDVLNSTGSIGQDQNNWPALANGTAPPDTDHDGMPDAWETAHGFNPNDASDRNKDQNNNGYTNVEEYLNELAAM